MPKSLPRAPIERATRWMFTRIISALARTLRDRDLSVAELAALHLCDEDPDLLQSQLADHLNLSAPAASRLIDGLVGRELLRREESAADRRARHVKLTPRGHALLDTLAEVRMTIFDRLLGSMPRALISRVLGRIDTLRREQEEDDDA
jgi:DNA-binding MarR family transcriptional regulator